MTAQQKTAPTLPAWMTGTAGKLAVAALIVVGVYQCAAVAASDQETAEAAQAWTQMQAAGLKSPVGVRDWANVDGDRVQLNGVWVELPGSKAVPVALPAGPVRLEFDRGLYGCASVEFTDAAGATFRVCRSPGGGGTITTF